jgi:hypothetical protein
MMTEVFHGFSTNFSDHAGIVPRVGYDHFLPNPFQSTFYLMIYNLATDSTLK